MANRTRPTPGVYAANTAAAMERLETGQPGDTVTEAEMGRIIGEPCGAMTTGYGVITRAIRYVLRDRNVYWQRDRTIPGWRCLTPDQRVDFVKHHGTKRVRRLAKKNLGILSAPTDGLSEEQKRDQQILQVTQAMIFGATRAEFRKQLIGRVADWGKLREPTAPQLIDLMKGST